MMIKLHVQVQDHDWQEVIDLEAKESGESPGRGESQQDCTMDKFRFNLQDEEFVIMICPACEAHIETQLVPKAAKEWQCVSCKQL